MPHPAPLQSIPHVPEVPFDVIPTTYTRFGTTFEPYEYTGWVDEQMSWKETCFIGDWSPLSKLRVTGPDAIRFFADISVNSFAKFAIGQAKHIILCNDDGKVMGEGVLMREAEDRLLFTGGPVIPWAQYLFERGSYDATAELVTACHYIFQLQGPTALFVLEKATGKPQRDIGFMRFRPASIAGMTFQVLRQGMSGEIGFELHGSADEGVAVYNALLAAGAEFGIRRLGGRTKMVNHVEACFPTPNVDYIPAIWSVDGFHSMMQERAPAFLRLFKGSGSYEAADISAYYRSPVELGWARNIKFDHDFIGRAALEREVAAPRRTMVTLVWNAEDVSDVHASLLRPGEPYDFMEMPRNLLGAMWVDQILSDGVLVGASTSRCYSYFFREMLSLATIDGAFAEPGTEVTVVWGRPGFPQKHIRATVAPAPYKRDNRKIDLSALPSYIDAVAASA
jgi:glycine cleavage system aminomethyltransferase T